jgi:hypothetical protein
MTREGWTAVAIGAVAALAAAAWCLWPAARSSAQPPQRPNIVLVIGDDMSWHDGQVYGSQDVPTPNMMRLAREGMVFDRAF